MDINIRLNGIKYTTLHSLETIPDQEIKTFLQAWYNDLDHVIGHTSGSTGTPKEIRLLKQDMLASAHLTNQYFNIGPTSRLLLCLSPSYIAGKMMIVRAMLSGADLVCVPPSSSPLKEVKQDLDFAAFVPLQVETLLAGPRTTDQLSRVKQIIIGGAVVSPPLERQLQNLPTACYATYGMTETVSHVALRAINGREKSPYYFALGNVRFETDERDCLVIHAPHLQQNTFVTNDIVQLSDSTHFQWLGRLDNVINSGGIKLFPEKIEAKIAPFLTCRFFITREDDSRLGQKAVLVMEGKPWNETERAHLMQQLRQHLLSHEIPKSIYFQEHFKETYSGKITRERE